MPMLPALNPCSVCDHVPSSTTPAANHLSISPQDPLVRDPMLEKLP